MEWTFFSTFVTVKQILDLQLFGKLFLQIKAA